VEVAAATSSLAGLLENPLLGLIGFDVGTARRFVRPELLRLLKRGKKPTANEQYALAA
jgi:hypothetical protein